MSKNTDFISGQSECSDSHNELDDPKLDNHELDNPYRCNQTGMCLVIIHTSIYKITIYINSQTY